MLLSQAEKKVASMSRELDVLTAAERWAQKTGPKKRDEPFGKGQFFVDKIRSGVYYIYTYKSIIFWDV